MDEKMLEFANIIRKSKSIVFFGGAGVSTESGLKDYRSEDGLYTTVKQYGIPPETILSHSFFYYHTDVFYNFYGKYFLESDPKPNAAHRAIAYLEKMGKLSAVVTQNIDGLHQMAGSKNVIELHGTINSYYCVKCHKKYGIEKAREAKGGIPECDCGGVIRPDVVLYDEGLDENVLNGAIKAIYNADAVIVGGTSLAVYPAAGLIKYYWGENLVLINKSETAYDSMAKLIFRDSIGKVMKEAVRLVYPEYDDK